MELKDTIELMTSNNYQDRFKAEYMQLVIRRKKLATMLNKYMEGSLDFEPATSPHVLFAQCALMDSYIFILKQRALEEHIDLEVNTCQ